MDKNTPFPKLKPTGTIVTKNTPKDNEIDDSSKLMPSNTQVESNNKNDFKSKIKFFEQKSQNIAKQLDIRKTMPLKPVKKDILQEKNKDNKEKKEEDKHDNNNKQNETKTKTDKPALSLGGVIPQKLIATKTMAVPIDKKEDEKLKAIEEEVDEEKVNKAFLKRRTYDFGQLQRPSNYSDIEKYWDYEKNIIDCKILDFTILEEIIQILKDSEEDFASCDTTLEFILNTIEFKSEQYNEEPNYINELILKKHLVFFMILTLNLKDNHAFIKTIFIGEANFFNKLVEFLDKIKNKNKFLKIISNLFSDEEYKSIFFNKNKPDKELEELYNFEKSYFTEKYPGCKDKEKKGINEKEKESYGKLFSDILKFDLNYTNFFHTEVSDPEIKIAYKYAIVQSLIRVVFSKQKKNFTKEEFYGFNVIKRIIDKDMEETIQKYGDEYKTLFRKEDICDDFLKFIFFIFGNNMMVQSFVKPVKKELLRLGFTNRDINKEEFDSFINVFIDNLNATIPDVLKLLLKLLYDSVLSHFTIEKDNYGPLYTTLIFNYFISPRIQAIFNINAQKNKFVRSLNRILRNACFNFKFSDGDPLSIFNDSIEKNHLKIKTFMEEKIIGIDITNSKVKGSLENIFNEKNLIYPNFLFNHDSYLLSASLKNGINEFFEAENKKSENSDEDWVLL